MSGTPCSAYKLMSCYVYGSGGKSVSHEKFNASMAVLATHDPVVHSDCLQLYVEVCQPIGISVLFIGSSDMIEMVQSSGLSTAMETPGTTLGHCVSGAAGTPW